VTKLCPRICALGRLRSTVFTCTNEGDRKEHRLDALRVSRWIIWFNTSPPAGREGVYRQITEGNTFDAARLFRSQGRRSVLLKSEAQNELAAERRRLLLPQNYME
jgi:hypothetical protein